MPSAPTDPAPFLSTIATASSALVAIVGGLLVARFVTLSSEQEGAQRVLADAEARLDVMKMRAEEAYRKRLRFDLGYFFSKAVMVAVSNGVLDAAGLREVGGYSGLTDTETERHAMVIDEELARAEAACRELLPSEGGSQPADWDDFRREHPELQIEIEDAWEIQFVKLTMPRSAPRRSTLGIGSGLPMVATMPQSATIRLQRGMRRDALKAQEERAQQQLEDLEGEVARLRQAREAIVRPKGLALGLSTLIFFTLVGVVVPLFIMSRAPRNLSGTMGIAVFVAFMAGLVTLLGYMTVLARRLQTNGSRGNSDGPGSPS